MAKKRKGKPSKTATASGKGLRGGKLTPAQQKSVDAEALRSYRKKKT